MTPLGAPLFLAALVVQSGPSDSLRFTAMRLPESALVLETRARPFAVRDAISDALARGELDAARRIAAAYAVAWRDSFLVREVERFAAWPLERRAAKVWADSARRAGIAAYGRDGATAAIRIWRRALGRITPIDDTAGVAGLLGNIGAGLLAESRVDSAVTYLDRARLLASGVGDIRVEANAVGALAGVSEDRGDLAAAQAGYVRALALRERIGDTRGAAADHNNLGLLAQTGGDLDEAHRQFEAALALNRLAGLASVDGDFALAVRLYRDALATWRAREQWADAAAALHGLGQVELRRGDYPAARASLGEALAIYDRTGPLADALAVRRDLAGALAAAGELQGALDELRHAQRLADSARASPGVRAGIALTRADLAARLNTPAEAERLYARDTTAARRELAQAAADLERLGDPVATAAALGQRAGLEAAAGLPAAAESLYRAALERLRGRTAPDVSWHLHSGLGLARRAQGDAEEAARELRLAIAEVERPSRSLTLAERRSAFLADKWEVYAQLALTERGRSRPGAAFEASERLRAREMLELLARGRVAAPADTAADLVAREQDLRRRIAELTRELEDVTASDDAVRGSSGRPAPQAGREALDRAQEAYTDLLLEIGERAPQHASLVSREAPRWQDVGRRLAPEQAFIEYLVSDSGSLAFVVTRDTAAVVDLGAGRRDLARLVAFARGTLEPGGSLRTDSLWRGPLRQLHEYLIAPIEEAGLLAGKTRLVLVPHAELHYLPFAALVDRAGAGRFLMEHYEVTVTPSAAVWLALGDRGASRAGSGVLALAPRPDVLPGSRREVAAVGGLVGADARVLTAGGATEDAFRREAPRRRIVHLATYGVLNKHNPLFSFVELAPGGGQDGRLEVHEVFGLHLTADLVVLSACETGVGSGALADVPAGDDWVGLVRAFLHAGAAHVVATLWRVDDWATEALMERFYESLATGAEPARALALAQRALVGAPATAHPRYWAGFVAVGGSDGR